MSNMKKNQLNKCVKTVKTARRRYVQKSKAVYLVEKKGSCRVCD